MSASTAKSFGLSDELINYVNNALTSLAEAVNDIPSLSFVSFLRENILYVFVVFYILWYIKAYLSVSFCSLLSHN